MFSMFIKELCVVYHNLIADCKREEIHESAVSGPAIAKSDIIITAVVLFATVIVVVVAIIIMIVRCKNRLLLFYVN